MHADAPDLGIITARALGGMAFPPIRWAVEGLLPEGLALLAGAPKSGKSWLALDLLLAVATGTPALGRFTARQGRAMYLSLEDSPRRLQTRMAILGGHFPEGLDLSTGLQGRGLVGYVADYLAGAEGVRLVVVDTLGRALRGDLNDYNDTTAAIGPLQRLALDMNVAVVLIHHSRKGGMEGGDPFEASLGSTGIFGAVDSSFILEKVRGEPKAILHVVGRDIEDRDIVLELDKEHMRWMATDEDPAESKMTPERRSVLVALRRAGGSRSPAEIAEELGIEANAATKQLLALVKDGLVVKSAYGRYQTPLQTVQSKQSPESNSAQSAHSATPFEAKSIWNELGIF